MRATRQPALWDYYQEIMPLPILKSDHASHQTLIRYYHKTETEWTRHIAEETALDIGSAFHNVRLPRTHEANRILDAQLPVGMTPQQALDMANAHFDAVGTQCWQWLMNPSAPEESTAQLAEFLLASGYRRWTANIMYLNQLPKSAIEIRATDLTIIPTRASFKHARQLFEESAQRWDTPELADASMLHLDDPHYDALLALRDGQVAGHAGVLAIGEIGLIEQVYVMRAMRRQGVATALMSRALEICARSLFKHVFLSCGADNLHAIATYEKFGFRKLADIVAYQRED